MAQARRSLTAAGVLVACLVSGCGTVISSVSADMADSLSTAILNQDDPQLVRDALPSYLLLLDSLVSSDPENPDTLGAAAKLYAAYGATLVSDADRARSLTTRAREYGTRALCAADNSACELQGIQFDAYASIINSVDEDAVEALHTYSLATLAWIRTHADDYKALAALPRVEVALQRVMQLEPNGDLAPSTCMYLGVLNTLRPASLGGQPELGREWFERGIALSAGRDLAIKVEYARSYARLLYDRELHDRLLNEVLAAEVEQQDLVLSNQLARAQAIELLQSADEYFF